MVTYPTPPIDRGLCVASAAPAAWSRRRSVDSRGRHCHQPQRGDKNVRNSGGEDRRSEPSALLMSERECRTGHEHGNQVERGPRRGLLGSLGNDWTQRIMKPSTALYGHCCRRTSGGQSAYGRSRRAISRGGVGENRSGHLTGEQARNFERMVSGRRKSTRGLAMPVGAIGALLLILSGPPRRRPSDISPGGDSWRRRP